MAWLGCQFKEDLRSVHHRIILNTYITSNRKKTAFRSHHYLRKCSISDTGIFDYISVN